MVSKLVGCKCVSVSNVCVLYSMSFIQFPVNGLLHISITSQLLQEHVFIVFKRPTLDMERQVIDYNL